MNLLAERFVLPDTSIENLRSLGFHYESEGIFSKRFPAYKWNGETVLEGCFRIFEDSRILRIDLYTMDGKVYAPFYREDENNIVVDICIKHIIANMKKIGVKRRVKKVR